MQQQSSLIADLKRFGGPIRAMRIETTNPPPKKQEKIAEPSTNFIVREIAEKIKPPFFVIEDAHGIVHDNSTIAARCAAGHIHKYYLKDVSLSGLTKCLTCNTGNKFTTLARESIEKILGIPFVKAEYARGDNITFANPILKIKLVCVGVTGADYHSSDDGIFSLKIHKTHSERKLRDSICALLLKFDGLAAGYRDKISVATKPRESYTRGPLPMSPELANIVGPGNGEIVDSKSLCLEQCGQ